MYGKDAPHHRGVFTKVGLDIEIKLVKLLQQEQRFWMNLAMFSAVFCCFVIRGLRASVLRDVLFPLPRSPVVLRSCRSAAASGRSMRKARETERSRDGGRKRTAAFHRLRPLTSITETDAQISGGETRQDYKDIRRFPDGSLVLSCSCHSVYRCHSAVMAAFVSFHA